MAISAKFAADFGDFYAAVQKAEVSLKSFESGAGKVETSLNRVTNSLSGTKLIQDATLMSEAVDRIGGVSKLTESELAKVSAQAKEAAAKLVAMGQDVPPGIQRIADAGGKAAGIFEDLSGQVKATALGFISAQAILGTIQGSFRTLTAFVEDSIHSYAAAEAASKKMTTALQAQGTATPAVIQQFNDLAGQFQRTTVYSDDLINEMEALLTQVGDVAPGQMDKALTAATNLASGLGIDLHTATLMVAKASEENVGALKKAGVQLDETRVKGEGMSYILGVINEKFGGQAQSEIDTYAGKVKQLGNEWDNFKEAVGRSIVEDPLLQALLSHLKEGITGIGESAGKYTPTITEWWARLAGGGLGATALGYFNSIDLAIQDINRDIAKMPTAPKAFAPQGDPFAKMMADAKAASAALIDQWKKEDEAAKKHAEAFAAMFGKFSGGDATRQMQLLDEVFRKLAASGQLTAQQVEAIVKEAISLQSEGAKLTPRLWDMVVATGALSPGLSKTALNMRDLGTQVQVAVPEMEKIWRAIDKLAPDPKVIGISNLRDEFAHLMVVSPETMLKGVQVKTVDVTKAVGELATALSQLAQISGSGVLGGFIRDLSTIVGSLDTASKGVKSFEAGQEAFKNKDTLAGIVGMATGIIGIATAAIAAGKAIANMFDKNKGRDLVVDFADTFGGFDTLHVKLQELGAAGEELWIKLTQGVGRNNPAQAQAVIDEVAEALANQKRKQDAATVSTEAGAQATIETAAQAAVALDELNGRLVTNADAWGTWSEDVTGYLQKLADDIRNMPLPGPTGVVNGGGGNGTGVVENRTVGPRTYPKQEVVVRNNVYLDGRQVTEAVGRAALA